MQPSRGTSTSARVRIRANPATTIRSTPSSCTCCINSGPFGFVQGIMLNPRARHSSGREANPDSGTPILRQAMRVLERIRYAALRRTKLQPRDCKLSRRSRQTPLVKGS